MAANPDGIMQRVASGEGDIGVGTGEAANLSNLPPRVAVLMGEPIRRSAIMPADHPLVGPERLTLQALGAQPLIGYGAKRRAAAGWKNAFAAAGIVPHYVVRANDSDIIKTYVAQRLGVGIVPTVLVLDTRGESSRGDLVALDVTALLPAAYTTLMVRRNMYLRPHIVDFIGTLAPGWDRATIQRTIEGA